MSVKNDQKQELVKEVVVNEVEQTTAMVEVPKEDKKAKKVATAKKVAKVAGIALLGGVLGYFCGYSKGSKKDEYYDDSDIIDAEVIDSDVE